MMNNYKLYLNIFSILFLFSCADTPPEEEKNWDQVIGINLNDKIKPESDEALPESGVIEAVSPLKILNNEQSGTRLPSRIENSNKSMGPSSRLADIMKSKAKDPKSFEEVVPFEMVMDNLELITAIKVFSETLDFEYLVDPGVKGFVKSDISLNDTLTIYDGWKLFEQILYINNAYASVDEAGIIRVYPLSKLALDSVLKANSDAKGNVSLLFYDFKNINATEALNVIKSYLSPNASASVLTSNNSLLVVEVSSNVEKLNSIINALDQNAKPNWPQIAYKCQYVSSQKLYEELQSAIPVLGFTISAGDASGQGVKMVALERMEILVVSAPSQSVLAEIYKWIKILDTHESDGEEKVFYYPVKHGVSEDLVAALQLFFPNTANAVGATTSSSNSTSSRAGTNANNNSRTTGNTANRNRTTGTRPGSSNEIEPESLFDEVVTVFEDIRRNQLVIRTKAKTFAMVKAILRHLDAPAMQVLIEVTAVEVELGDGLEFGFEYAASDKFGSGDNESSVGVGSPIVGEPSFAPPGGVTPGISLLLQSAGVDNEFAFVQAVAGDSKTQLLFTPHILTLNGEEAEINIGENVPIRTGTTSTSANNDFEQIEYRNTGVLLKVLPQVSADKYVTLETEIEISSIVEQEPDEVLIDSPTFNENKVRTKLLIKNNETILLGGIITKGTTKTNSGVPFLKDIPWIGTLFKSSRSGEQEKELILFIKATVIEQQSDFQQVLERYNDSLEYRLKSPEIK